MKDKRVFFILIVALLLQLPLHAQDSEYPTLDALNSTDIPAFSYAEMVGRMSRMDPRHQPPANPPQYQIGDRDELSIHMGAEQGLERMDFELRAMTNRVLIWVQETANFPQWRAQGMANRVEREVLDLMGRLFQFSEPPGVDGDPRLTIAIIFDPDGTSSGYFSVSDTRPRRLDSWSDQREMLVVNLKSDDEYDFFDDILIGTIAHEYLHILHHHSDPGEESWLDEGIATFADFHATKPLLSYSAAHSFADTFLEMPHIGLTQWQVLEDRIPKYGAGFLFVMYLTERFGDEIAPRLLADPTNGWRSVENVLREVADVSADEVFADWVLANFYLDNRRGYGYRQLDADLTAPVAAHSYNSFPATHKGETAQYGSDYINVDVRGADKLLLSLWQTPDAKLTVLDAPRGDHYYYALATDSGHSRLTRAFNIDTTRQAWLEFRLWYELEEDLEYAYVTFSPDDGETWLTPRGSYTKWSNVYDEFYTYGYTGTTSFWRNVRIDLSSFTPGELLVRFELMSDYATSYRGVAIDEVRIRAIDFYDGFETPDDAWHAEGWIRSDNRLPNNTWLQAVQETRGGIQVSRELISGNGELTVDVLPGVTNVLVAVSPIVPQTSLPTEYELELYLLDEAGEILAVSRECTVTTTDPLNFRDAPSGNKIGLIPQGTTVDALDRRDDWFKVDYNGRHGWVSAGYVTTAGNCP